MHTLVVVNQLEDFDSQIASAEIVTAREYIGNPKFSVLKGVRVFNLCRSYVYQSDGYYVSLLAEARGHKIMPDLTTIQDTKTTSIIRIKSEEMDKLIEKSLKKVDSKKFEMDIIFGHATEKQFEELALQLFDQFPAPLLKAFFKKKIEGWRLQDVDPISTKQLTEAGKKALPHLAEKYLNTGKFKVQKHNNYKYSLAILVNPDELEPPSDKDAIKKFIKAAEKLGIQATTIGRNEYNKVAEYDGLFIRETTNVNHHTYRFARRAAVKGLTVIDDPDSILKCTNKVYLAELLERNNIPVPKTMLIHKDNVKDILKHFEFPIILKLPDSCSSQGVHKASTKEELAKLSKEMLNRSDLIIAQEFLPTDFDWRIGIIEGKPFYACKYFMAKNHWQITNWHTDNDRSYGAHEAVAIEDVPEYILNIATKSANLIGKGFYGVDVKEANNKAYIIEINDNPSIDAGVEDEVLKDELYNKIMQYFLKGMQNAIN